MFSHLEGIHSRTFAIMVLIYHFFQLTAIGIGLTTPGELFSAPVQGLIIHGPSDCISVLSPFQVLGASPDKQESLCSGWMAWLFSLHGGTHCARGFRGQNEPRLEHHPSRGTVYPFRTQVIGSEKSRKKLFCILSGM